MKRASPERTVLNFISSPSRPPDYTQVPLKPEPDMEIRISGSPLSPTEVDLYIVTAPLLRRFWTELGPTGIPVVGCGATAFLPFALQLGCRDYLKDPWDYTELQSRCRRLLTPSKLSFSWGAVSVTPSELIGNDRRVSLSYPQYRILRTLQRNAGRLVHRATLQYTLWGEERPRSRGIDMHVTALRRKLNMLADKELNPHPIRTVYGVGYLLIHNQSTG